MITTAQFMGIVVCYMALMILAGVLGWHMPRIIDVVTDDEPGGGGQMPDLVPEVFD